MAISGDAFAIAKALEAGAEVQDDAHEVGRLFVKALKAKLSRVGTGRVYTTNFFTKNGKAIPIGERSPHQASAPGNPPAPDTYELMNSVDYAVNGGGSGVELKLGAAAEHATYTEFGTKNMQARPWFRSTITEMMPKALKMFASGIEARERAAARRSGGTG